MTFHFVFVFFFAHTLKWPSLEYSTGCPPKKGDKKGRGSKFGQPHPSNVRFLKAHLVDIKCV